MRVKVTVPVELKKYPKLKLEELRLYIADSLRYEQARTVEDEEEKIKFTVGFFRSFWSWTSLSTICGGEINFQTDDKRILIVSRLRFTDTVVIASALTVLMALYNNSIISAGEDNVISYIFAWLWFVGGNMMISAVRWRRFIRHCIRETADRVYIPLDQLMANKAGAKLTR